MQVCWFFYIFFFCFFLKEDNLNNCLLNFIQAMTDDNRTLGDYGFTSAIARAQAPASIGLVYRKEGEIEADNPGMNLEHCGPISIHCCSCETSSFFQNQDVYNNLHQ